MPRASLRTSAAFGAAFGATFRSAVAVVAALALPGRLDAFTVYVSNEKDNTVSIIDSNKLEVVKTIKVGQSSVGAGGQIYSKTIPNLTQDQALQYAQKWYGQLVAHEMRLEDLEMPGDNDLDITSIIEFSGTGTAFDQQYFPDNISRRISFDGGYGMTIAAKNHAPDSTVIV